MCDFQFVTLCYCRTFFVNISNALHFIMMCYVFLIHSSNNIDFMNNIVVSWSKIQQNHRHNIICSRVTLAWLIYYKRYLADCEIPHMLMHFGRNGFVRPNGNFLEQKQLNYSSFCNEFDVPFKINFKKLLRGVREVKFYIGQCYLTTSFGRIFCTIFLETFTKKIPSVFRELWW